MLEALNHESWFFGFVPRKFVKECLRNEGDWCVRATETQGKVDYLACVKKSDGQVHDYVFKYEPNRGWYFSGTEMELYPSAVELLRSKSETIQTLQLTNSIDRPLILIPAGSLEWEDCDAMPLGKGTYGTVVRAIATINQVKYDVAVKVPRTVGKSGSRGHLYKAVLMEIDQMIHEAQVMRNFRHENILQCFGIDSFEAPIKLVLRLCPGGSLLNHLREHGNDISFEERLIFILEAARGLKYLHTKWKCIHRDIASRNCLIAKDGKLKISDFGICLMEGMLTPNEDIIKVPIPWLAPECLTSRPRFTTKSDIFAFAVLIYEIMGNGQEPWPEFRNTEEITKQVRCGKRMALPATMNRELYRIITECWGHLPYGRPDIWEVVLWVRRLLNHFELPKPDQRSICKISKNIAPSPIVEDPNDFELDECSPPPTTEEAQRIEKITAQRQKRLQGPHIGSGELMSDDLSSDFTGGNPRTKGLHRNSKQRQINSKEPGSRQSENSSSAEGRIKPTRTSQSARPRQSPASLASTSKPITPKSIITIPSRGSSSIQQIRASGQSNPRRSSNSRKNVSVYSTMPQSGPVVNIRTGRTNRMRNSAQMSPGSSNAELPKKSTARISTKRQ